MRIGLSIERSGAENRCWARSAEDDSREGESACLASARGWGDQRKPTKYRLDAEVEETTLFREPRALLKGPEAL